MKRTQTIVIGGGQAGLAMSRSLTERRVSHVVLERGRIGERWRSERWDSSRLLTPNWQSRLPHWHYEGDDPDGYMTADELAGYLERYARSFGAPVESGTTVRKVTRSGGDYRVETDRGVWCAPTVVVATGHCDRPWVPGIAKRLPAEVTQLVPTAYRNPQQLPEGGVLIVGAAASGLQLADELLGARRAVTLAVGSHVRLPRRYRGQDILWWLEIAGLLRQEPGDDVDPSFGLIGKPDHRDLDLGLLQERGARLVGRAKEIDGHRVRFSRDLGRTIARADRQLERVLSGIDAFIRTMQLDERFPEEGPVARVQPLAAPEEIDLAAEGIRSVIWATGFRRSYPWLQLPVLDERGEIRHERGVTPAAGLYVLGLDNMRRRNSMMIDGVGNDAWELGREISTLLGGAAA